MVNLSQISDQIKSSPAPRPNLATPAGMSLAYKQLKALDWVCHDPRDRDGLEIHPTERVPIFRLNSASIRRDKQTTGDWIIEVAGGTYRVGGDLEAITAEVLRLSEEAELPAPRSLAEEIAIELKVQNPQLARRIDDALTYVLAGQTEFPHYGTTWDNATRQGNWLCECPDAVHRQPRFVGGIGCKHTLAGEIQMRIERERQAVAHRKLVDLVEGGKRYGR